MTYTKPAATRQRLSGLMSAPSHCDCDNVSTKACKIACN